MWRFLNEAFQEPNAYMAMLSERYADITRSSWKMGALRTVVRRMPGLFINILISWFRRQCRQYLKTIDQVPACDRIEVTYDQLCDQPNATIRHICSHFSVPDNDFDFSSMI